METIEDIIREKRATADEIERKVNNQFSRELVKSLRKEADRIEKACRSMELMKGYEYSVKEFGGYVQPLHEDSVSLSFLDGRAIGDENHVIVRRKVGEWEEVK